MLISTQSSPGVNLAHGTVDLTWLDTLHPQSPQPPALTLARSTLALSTRVVISGDNVVSILLLSQY